MPKKTKTPLYEQLLDEVIELRDEVKEMRLIIEDAKRILEDEQLKRRKRITRAIKFLEYALMDQQEKAALEDIQNIANQVVEKMSQPSPFVGLLNKNGFESTSTHGL